MTTSKFDEFDRARVIRELEERWDIRLKKIKSHRKWRQDESGRNYWVLGGTGSWHGIPEEMMEAELRSSAKEGMIVIAERRVTTIEVFAGLAEPLCDARNRLSRASDGSYKFNCRVRENHLQINEVPTCMLERFASISYGGEEKERDRRLRKAEELLAGMSTENRKKILDQLEE